MTASCDHCADPVVDAGYYSRVLRRGWALLVVGLLVGLVAGFGWLAATPRTYSATASVLVTTTGATETEAVGQRTVGGDVNLDTEAQLLRSADVVDRVLATTGGAFDVSGLLARVSVQVPANTTVLDVTFTGATPKDAQEGAQAFAEAYLANRQEVAQLSLDQMAASYARRVEAAQREQHDLRQTLDGAKGSEREGIQARLQGVATRLAALSEAQVGVEATVVTPGRIINQPALPRTPSSPNRTMALGSGAALGLFVGLALAMSNERSRPRLRDEDDVRRELGLPLLAAVPPAAGANRACVAAPLSAQSVAFAQLRRRLEQVSEDAEQVIVAPVSSTPTALHTALNLCWQHARQGTRARLLVAAGEIRTGRFRGEGVLATKATLNVTDARADPEAIARRSPTPTIATVVVTDAQASLVELLARPGDAAVLVVERRRDRAPAARRAVALLEARGVQVVGVVLHPHQRPPVADPDRIDAGTTPTAESDTDGTPATAVAQRVRSRPERAARLALPAAPAPAP